MLDKRRIKASFSNAASTYEEYADVQKLVARELLHRFTHTVTPSIDAALEGVFTSSNSELFTPAIETVRGRALDIGCGTGTIARTLQKTYPGLTLYSTDIAEGMVKKAHQLFTSKTLNANSAEQLLAGRLLCAESEALPFVDSAFDFLFSSLVYQWVDKTETAFKEAHRVLRPNGLLLFATLGPDTLHELRQCYTYAQSALTGAEPLAPYKAEDTLVQELKKADFKSISVKREKIKKSYSSMFDLLGRLKKIGAFRRTDINSSSRLSTDGTLGQSASTVKKAAHAYKERYPDTGTGIVATYDVLYFTAIK